MDTSTSMSAAVAFACAIIGLFNPIISQYLKQKPEKTRFVICLILSSVISVILFFLLKPALSDIFNPEGRIDGIREEYALSMGGPEQNVVFKGIGTLVDRGKLTGYGEILSVGTTHFSPVVLEDYADNSFEYYDGWLIYRGEIKDGLPHGDGNWYFPRDPTVDSVVALSGRFEEGEITIASHYDEEGLLLFHGVFFTREGDTEVQRHNENAARYSPDISGLKDQ